MTRLSVLFSITAFLVGSNLSAQLTLGIQSERHFPIMQGELPDGNFFSDGSIDINSLAKFSYGSGYAFGLFLEHQMRGKVSLGLDYSWLLGKPYEQFSDTPIRQAIEKHRGQSMRISPYIQSNFLLKEGLELYFSLGPVMSFANRVDIEYESFFSDFGIMDEYHSFYRHSHNFGFGGRVGLGLRYLKWKSVQLSLGVKGIFLNYWPGQREILFLVRNGEDRLEGLTERQRTWIYVDKVEEHVNGPVDTTQPYERLKESFPFSSLGLVLALHYKLERK